MSEDSEARQQDFVAAYKAVEVPVNKDRYRRALQPARNLTKAFGEFAQAWFILALVCELLGRLDEARKARVQAVLCDDYSDVLEGDLLRDQLMSQVRRGRVDPIFWRTSMVRLTALHDGDTNRLACAAGLEGRYLYSRKSWRDAVVKAEAAHAGMTDPQWVANNLVYWLKAALMYGQPHHEVTRIYELILGTPREYMSIRKLRRAEAIYRRGRFGCRLDDFLNWLYWRIIKRV